MIVVGAGVVGTATALHLLSRGRRVLLLDRLPPGHGASFGNAGIIEASYALPIKPPSAANIPAFFAGRLPAARLRYPDGLRYVPWMLNLYAEARLDRRQRSGAQLWPLIARALAEHRTLMTGTAAEKYARPFTRLKIYRTQESFSASTPERQMAATLGIPFDVLDTAAALRLEPALQPVFHRAVHFPSTLQLTSPGGVVDAYAKKFKQAGGGWAHGDIQAVSPAAGTGWDVITATTTYHAAQVVLCTGAWTPELLKPLGCHFPMGVKRGYHRHFRLDGATLTHSVSDVDIGYVMAPTELGVRLTTGAEFADPDSPANPIQVEQALPYAKELLPLSDAVEKDAWMGPRSCFADSLPVIGAAPRHAGLWLNFGQGHLGMTLGPVTGRLLSEIMCGEKTFCDPAPYRPDRFGVTSRA